MSTIDQAQIGESPPAKDRRPNHWDMPPANDADDNDRRRVQRFAINGIKVWRTVNFSGQLVLAALSLASIATQFSEAN